MASDQTSSRRFDPDRKQRIIDAALDVIVAHGVQGTTHRRVAMAAGVPLGSMSYHFAGMDDLLHMAFRQVAQAASAAFVARLSKARNRRDAIEAIIDIIAGNIWSTPRTLLLSYELYAFAARKPELAAVMRDWMQASRDALGRFFDPLTCRALDALVEGMGIHDSVDHSPLGRGDIADIVHRICRQD
ncbi:TetR/AcrR family transcriptional regulator [Komagataeibacter oboediens]|uniref:TetR family transcriptional regulator n=1 Tax=Komagataeibacter oboediens TaxID=65958 RepID=A0ABS5SP23_9PROT|nr:TetR family transcriptional regulator [Komagataeibacter oboediens]MBL7234146.1 TetR family transcriptional regulator [Komagataeibacter oboediens]MBT0675958.1 TetR family transcriptional regulator [Komagataeibacter oboediens]MBT0679200.1 TetR family transcriptional regulator [Komagataeibacter oboediens]MBV0888610.1 TetR family transcriptional regulator [Komagataeibacter oboediens]MCK9821111.1 TetR family transcriptional regulator [Komagataeibacter oboediens]